MPLDSPSVRQELAKRLTEQLAHAGNQQANNFRPALQLAIESAINTDTFRSIFRSAVRRIHAAVLSGQGGGSGLDLQDSAVLTSTLQLGNRPRASSSCRAAGRQPERYYRPARSMGLWQLDSTISWIAIGTFVGALAAALGAVALARTGSQGPPARLGAALRRRRDRGRAADRPMVAAASGARSPAVEGGGDAIWHGTADLRTSACGSPGTG